jgi:hypothetical protein
MLLREPTFIAIRLFFFSCSSLLLRGRTSFAGAGGWCFFLVVVIFVRVRWLRPDHQVRTALANLVIVFIFSLCCIAKDWACLRIEFFIIVVVIL